MFHLLFLGAILLANLIDANVNITCYECKGCTSTPMKTSTDNRICLRIQMNCVAADIHIIDLTGDRMQSNYSSHNCGHTRVYSSTCTVAYHCCYTDKCNTFENPLLVPTSSSLLYALERIVISSSILFLYHCFSV